MGEIVSPTTLSVTELIQRILNLVPIILILVFIAMMVYGGFVRMTAAGDQEKEAASNKILTAAVIGFIIVVLAPLIINFLGQLLGLGTVIG